MTVYIFLSNFWEIKYAKERKNYQIFLDVIKRSGFKYDTRRNGENLFSIFFFFYFLFVVKTQDLFVKIGLSQQVWCMHRQMGEKGH